MRKEPEEANSELTLDEIEGDGKARVTGRQTSHRNIYPMCKGSQS